MASDDPTPNGGPALNTQSSTCFVRAKKTGLVSCGIQIVILIISVLANIFFFYHVGGYEYMACNENSSFLEPLLGNHCHGDVGNKTVIIEVTLLPEISTTGMTNENAPDEMHPDQTKEILNFETNSTDAYVNGTEFETLMPEITESTEGLQTSTSNIETAETQDEIIETTTVETDSALSNETSIISFSETTVNIGFMTTQLDMLELVQLSTMAYVLLCFLWLISQFFLMASLKFEILDFVVINAIFLSIATFYAILHGLFIIILLVNQPHVTLRTIAIVVGTVLVLFVTAAIGLICFTLTIAWYNYIVYMNDSGRCLCMSALVTLIKGRRRSPQDTAQQYAMTDMPHQNNNHDIPYADEPIRTAFNAF